MNGFAQRLARVRKECRMTQNEVAERLNVSFQAVSLWERGETTPEIDKLPEIAALYRVTTDWLLTGKEESAVSIDFEEPLSDRLFNEDRMYTYVKTCAVMKRLAQTVSVLPYARELHKGQVRKGREHVPYIYHPLLMACHALALGLDDDDVISAVLLHDICEDCGVCPEDLPVNDKTKEAVMLVTKNKEKSTEEYYKDISENRIATMVKLLDRCNNVSAMSTGFSKRKIVDYINETEKYIYPLLQLAKTRYSRYSNQIFLIKYHLTSVVSTLKHQFYLEAV
ncbi:MAG: helix-turn-helix domain-containing protein [Lachnospiraceae bacterium]|nr:helix-turn-helix domain-containing protein [Lachnospiraceae bacterium]